VKADPRWLSMAAVRSIHERLLAEHGGAPGIREEGLLDAALASPRNHLSYGEGVDVFSLAAAYAYALVRNHPFNDGNKRVALTVAGVFLELNGYRLLASEPDSAAAVVALADRSLDQDGFAVWLRSGSAKVGRPKAARSEHPRKRRGR
jgi:death-on-curing protein